MPVQAKEKIRVLHIIARMNIGGPAVIITDLIENLDINRFEQKLLVGFCDENEVDYLEQIHTDFSFARIDGFGRTINVFDDFVAFKQIRKEIRIFKPDIIHTHTAKAGVIGRIASILSFVPSRRVHTYHGHLLHGYFPTFITKLLVLLERILAIKTDLILTVGSKVRKDLLDAKIGNESKLIVTFPGVKRSEEFDRINIRRELSIERNRFVVTFVGRLAGIKRPERILEIGRILKKLDSNIKIVVVGGGEMLNSLKFSALKENLDVEFLGWRNDVNRVFAASDLAFLTSDNEGIPIVLIEAAMASLPLLSTNVGSVVDIVKDEVNGYLLTKNPNDFANKMLLIQENQALREILSANSRKLADLVFSLNRMVSQHSEIYTNLIAN